MKERIAARASELFTKKGVDKTSLAEIAAAAGISKGTLYYYFSTKNDLVFAVTEMHMEELTGNLFDLLKMDTTPELILEQLFETVPTAVTRSRLHIYLVREAVTDSPQLLKKFHQVYENWKKMLIENLSEFYPEAGEYEAFAGLIIAAVDGLVIQNLLGINQVPASEYVKLLKNSVDRLNSD
jgi:AcrR family transcriptional regulator